MASRMREDEGGARRLRITPSMPAPTVQACGLGSVNTSQYRIEAKPGDAMLPPTDKPPYRVPTMDEIADVRGTTGLRVASTFSGAGGSCLGYAMAGYSVVWASEFVGWAADMHAANHPGCVLDRRDIRTVTAAEILSATGLKEGELDVFDGSPPCDSFSMAGSREKKWGKAKAYSGHAAQRTDDLFFEYLRLLRGLRPRAFVAENVAGLVRGVAKGYFLRILAAMKEAGYVVRARVLDAQWLGVPQHRERVIFIGIREDLGAEPAFPAPLSYRYSIAEACTGLSAPPEPDSWLGKYAIGGEWDTLRPGQQSKKYFSLVRPNPDKPCPCITQCAGNTSAASVTHWAARRKFTIAELRRICSFPDDFAMQGSYARQWRVLGMSVPPLMMRAVASSLLPVLRPPTEDD